MNSMNKLRSLLLVGLAAFPLMAGAAAVTFEIATPDSTTDPNTSGAFTPVEDDLLIGICHATGTAAAAPTLTSSVGGFTFTFVDSATYSSSNHQIYVFVSDALVGASPASQTVTCEAVGDVTTGTTIVVLAVSGMSRTGLDAIRQIALHENQSSGTTPTTVFAGAALTGNVTIGAAANVSNPAGITEPTGWTEAVDTGFDLPSVGLEVVYRNSGSTSDTITWGSTYGSNGGAISIELDTSASGTPAEFVDVTVNAATNGYDIDYEVTGENATVYAVACNPGDAAPNQTELEAGQCGGGNAAVIAANEAATADTPADLALTASNKPVRMDVYVGCAGSLGDCTLETHADEDRSIRSGFLSVVMASHSSTGICNLDSYFDPDCADGDVFEYEDDTNEDADCNVSFETDGDFVLTPVAPGDCDGKRTFNISYQDISSATTGLFTAPTVGNFTTDDLICVNNSAPEAAEELDGPIVWTEDQAISAIDLNSFFNDADGDSLTYTLTTGSWPTGVSQSGTGNKDVTGTPTTENESGVAIVVRGTDECGDYAEYSFYSDTEEDIYVVNTWTVPNLDDLDVAAAEAAIIAAAPWRVGEAGLTITGYVCGSGQDFLNVATQDPAASAEATAFELIEAEIVGAVIPDLTGMTAAEAVAAIEALCP